MELLEGTLMRGRLSSARKKCAMRIAWPSLPEAARRVKTKMFGRKITSLVRPLSMPRARIRQPYLWSIIRRHSHYINIYPHAVEARKVYLYSAATGGIAQSIDNSLHERAQPVAEPEPPAAHALRLRDEHLVDQAVLDGLVGAEVEVARPA